MAITRPDESRRRRVAEPETKDGSLIAEVTVTVVGVARGTEEGLVAGVPIVGGGIVMVADPNFDGSSVDVAVTFTTPELGWLLAAVKKPDGAIDPESAFHVTVEL